MGGAGGRGGTGGGERVVSALTLAVSLWHSEDSLPGLQWDGKGQDRIGREGLAWGRLRWVQVSWAFAC